MKSGQADLDKIAARAQATLVVARRAFDDGQPAQAAQAIVQLAIVEQLALANALKIVEMARAAGESP